MQVATGSSFIVHRSSLFILLAFLAGSAAAQHVLTTIATGRGPTAALYDSIDRKVFVCNSGSATVSVIDPNTNTVTATIPVGEGPNAMCWSETSNKLFVACAPALGNGWVYVINAATDQVIATVSVGRNPTALAWCRSRNKVYCMNQMPGGPISVIGGADSAEKDVPVIPISGQTPNAIVYSPTSDRVYVSSWAYMQLGKVWVVNPTDDNVEATVACEVGTWELEVNPTGNRVYCSNHASNTVSVIDGATNRRISNLAVSGEPHAVRWIPTDKLFVGERWNHAVAFLQGESLSVGGRIPMSGNPGTMVYLPTTEKLFVANYLSNKVSACDARDGHEQVLVDLDVGSGPLGLAVYPDLKRVYVTNSWDTTVTVIADELPAALSDSSPHSSLLPPPSSLIASARAIPNPCRANAAVRFDVPGFVPLRLNVRDAAGRVVHSAEGSAARSWRPPRAGIYFCALTGGTGSASCRVTVR